MIAEILVADDDADLRLVVREFLVSRHFIVREATDGAQAFAMAAEDKPHLILMDIVMAGVYGSSAAQRLKDLDETKHIPIILMSGTAGEAALRDILQRPNVRFMKKPFELDVLEKNIRELLPKGGYTQ
ncbi:MAG: response regulator [Elusimicrobia bacterium]|nr:response regulator [Elusimicrobiota bacterium]